jgi:hypothetical protein
MSKITIDPQTATFYETDGSVIACVGTRATTAMFRLRRLPLTAMPEWQWLSPSSEAFDYFHQTIYRNERADVLDGERHQDLPPLPDEVTQAMIQEQTVEPDAKVSVIEFPYIGQYLAERPGQSMQVYVVLREDKYETACGDGCYRYFDSVFLQPRHAKDRINSIEVGGDYSGSLRQLNIRRDGQVITIPDHAPKLFEHYALQDVLRILSERIASDCELGGTPLTMVSDVMIHLVNHIAEWRPGCWCVFDIKIGLAPESWACFFWKPTPSLQSRSLPDYWGCHPGVPVNVTVSHETQGEPVYYFADSEINQSALLQMLLSSGEFEGDEQLQIQAMYDAACSNNFQ